MSVSNASSARQVQLGDPEELAMDGRMGSEISLQQGLAVDGPLGSLRRRRLVRAQPAQPRLPRMLPNSFSFVLWGAPVLDRSWTCLVWPGSWSCFVGRSGNIGMWWRSQERCDLACVVPDCVPYHLQRTVLEVDVVCTWMLWGSQRFHGWALRMSRSAAAHAPASPLSASTGLLARGVQSNTGTRRTAVPSYSRALSNFSRGDRSSDWHQIAVSSGVE